MLEVGGVLFSVHKPVVRGQVQRRAPLILKLETNSSGLWSPE